MRCSFCRFFLLLLLLQKIFVRFSAFFQRSSRSTRHRFVSFRVAYAEPEFVVRMNITVFVVVVTSTIKSVLKSLSEKQLRLFEQ